MSLRTRVTLATVIPALAAVVLVALVGTVLATQFLERSARSEIARQAELASEAVATLARSRDVPRTDAGERQAIQRFVAAFLERSDMQGFSPNLRDVPAELRDVLGAARLRALEAGETVQGFTELEGRRVAFAVVPGPPPVFAFRPVASLREAAREVGRLLLLAGLIGVGVAGLIGFWLGGRFTRPINRVGGTVAAVAGGRLDHRVPPDVTGRKDEIGELGRGVDAMAAAIAAGRDQQRGFFRAVAHELRTPLTNIQGYAEGLLDGRFADDAHDDAVGVIHEESVRLSRLVGDVMTLAQLDAGAFDILPTAGDAAPIVEATVSAAQEVAGSAGIDLRAEALPTPVTADPDRVRQILDNLVANALRVTPASGWVEVSCRPEPGMAVLSVADSGPGLEPEDVPNAFDRYYLWRRYRGVREVGTGLGLAIVAELADRMGGRVEVDPGGQTTGRGATFTVRLPATPTL